MSYVGVGDGGGGTTIASLEQMRRLDNLALTPRARWGKAEDFFGRLDGLAEKLPVYDGELYLEFHRGVFTSQAAFKLRHRQFEAALQAWEAVRTVAGGGPVPVEHWQRLAFNQFHDILPGSSIALAYEQLGAEISERTKSCHEAAARELARFADVDETQPGVTVFNTLPHPRTVVVETPQGLSSVPLQGLATAVATPGGTGSWTVSDRVLDNGALRAEFDEQGRLVRARDAAGEWPLAGACDFALHPDFPPNFDAWDVDHSAIQRVIATAGSMSLRVAECEPARATLRGTTQLGEQSRLEVAYVLEAGAHFLRVELTVDWRESARLLKFHAPTAARGRQAWFGAPYGTVARPQLPGMPREEAAWEVPATRWFATSNDAGTDGVLFLCERTSGVSCRDGHIGLSLLRAPQDPAYEFASQCVNDRKPDVPPDHGTHHIRFAMTRFTGLNHPPAALAEALFVPPVTVAGVARRLPAPPFRVTGLESVVSAWVLPAKNGSWVLRLVETAGCSGTVSVEFARPPLRVSLVDLLEQPLDTLMAPFELAVHPYQLLSIKVDQHE